MVVEDEMAGVQWSCWSRLHFNPRPLDAFREGGARQALDKQDMAFMLIMKTPARQ